MNITMNMDAKFALVLFVLLFAGFGLQQYFSEKSTPETTNNENIARSKPDEPPKQVNWTNESIYPTRIQATGDDNYRITLNGALELQLHPTNKADGTLWPKFYGKPLVSSEKNQWMNKLTRSLETEATREGNDILRITDLRSDQSVSQSSSDRVPLRLTFNDQLTLRGLSYHRIRETINHQASELEKQIQLQPRLKRSILRRARETLGNHRQTAGSSSLPSFSVPDNAVRAEVIHVYDGDTLKARLMDGTNKEVVVRLQGMDCPESSRNDKCENNDYREGMSCAEEIRYGKRASRIAKNWLNGAEIILIPSGDDGFERGHYGRRIAYVRMRAGEDFGLKMVNGGYCKDTSRDYPHQRGPTYRRYESPLKPLY